MKDNSISLIASELSLKDLQVQNTITLLENGATIPFISRYRKELTGSLDEVAVMAIHEKIEYYKELQKRKTTILSTIEEQGALNAELRNRIENCYLASELEDIYLPYKPKKRTRGEIARQKGLEGLAKLVMKQQTQNIHYSAQRFINADVENVEDALQGARDIIAEWINEKEQARSIVRRSFDKGARLTCKVIKGKEAEADKYRDYFKVDESLKRVTSHRFLAIKRGESEGLLRTSISPDEASPMYHLERFFVKADNESSEQVKLAVKDAYKRLLKPSIETEFYALTKEKADMEAIRIFIANLQQLLLASPLGNVPVLAIDPGYRTGCKLVCLDNQGNLLHNETIYPHPPQKDFKKAANKVTQLISMFKLDAIAIGNGTAGRETENFIQRLRFDREVKVFVVNEAGASIYSASKIARDEFPQYDVTVRGAVSIGRRLMDPLAELVKIDPKSIGVGQYQHDVDQKKLKNSLDQTVIACVNKVGVDVNTASKYLLSYVSGIGSKLAENIVEYRNKIGSFQTREQFKDVPGLGNKGFEQCAGFLRIRNAENVLDNSAVHPESYGVVSAMANDLKCTVKDLVQNGERIQAIDPEKYVSPKVGLPTLKDILTELEKPGRDPRTVAKVFEFSKEISKINDLKPNMVLPGIVTNITKFGVFVDVGIKENGLVHVSEIADKFISDPTGEVDLNQHVKVRVLSVDVARKRIALSMRNVVDG